MRILAIESTLDETAVAIVESSGGGVKILSSIVASSAKLHIKYGGVVPEIAAREQVQYIIPVLLEALGEYKIKDIDAIAVAYGPGMMGCLLIGVETAKVLTWTFGKPLLKVNHISAHLLANWITEKDQSTKNSKTQNIDLPEMPAVGLVASGGHTDFFLMESISDWKWVGGTRDDAVGEAFDKAGRIFGLPYPAGSTIDKISREVSDEDYLKLPKSERLPRPLIHDNSLDMSFSGLKAAVARLEDGVDKNLYIRDFSEAVTEVLVAKTKIALEKYKPKSLLLGGGVAANSKIREALKSLENEYEVKFFVPDLKYCGDNAAMIGAAAIMRPIEASSNLMPEPGLDVV